MFESASQSVCMFYVATYSFKTAHNDLCMCEYVQENVSFYLQKHEQVFC